jgi:OOP family OmpA-OmpF porin
MHSGKETPGQPWELQAGNTLYLLVNEASTTSMPLIEVAPEQAKKELLRTAAQVHVLSRAPKAQACDTPAPLALASAPAAPVVTPPVAKPPVPRAYALQADALFEFGKTELKVVGYNAIEGMAQRLKRDFAQVERIRVVGHSDPIGKPKRNRTLSLERAEKVAAQLRDRGVKPLHGFKTEGQGDDALIKTDCPHKPIAASKLCHAPNRRVEIIVYGARN